MKIMVSMVMIGMIASAWAAPLKVGDYVVREDFEGPDAVHGWGPAPGIEPGFQGGHAIAFAGPAAEGVPSPVTGSRPLRCEGIC